MQIIKIDESVSDNFVLFSFSGNITKIKPVDSLKNNFQRIGGCYMDILSNNKLSVWKFPVFITSKIIQEIIRNTCFECGGLMKDGDVLDNTWISFEDFGNDVGKRGTTMSKQGQPVIKKVRKCINCGHSHT